MWRASKVRDDAADCMIAKFEVKSSLGFGTKNTAKILHLRALT